MASTMQLEFSQAMSDFKTMFPEMDRDVIEAVLRANQGAVDATIDQLLAMSTDNQNERLRNELERAGNSPQHNVNSNPKTDSPQPPLIDTSVVTKTSATANSTADKSKNTAAPQLFNASSSPSLQNNLINTGASPKIKKTTILGESLNSSTANTSSPLNTAAAASSGILSSSSASNTPIKVEQQHNRKWNPPLLGPLPAGFLRISTASNDMARSDFELPDEQFAMMLQNEEFMNELRWNQEFMNALEKEQQGKEKTTEADDAAFKERLKHMGKVSRKKFLQMARVFTWQRNKKTTSARHIDSLPLKEEPSDDEDLGHKK